MKTIDIILGKIGILCFGGICMAVGAICCEQGFKIARSAYENEE